MMAQHGMQPHRHTPPAFPFWRGYCKFALKRIMEEYYNYIKSLHLIFVVTWFAGLFYMPRLFFYHIEARDKPGAEKEVLSAQFRIMERRL